MNKTFAFFRRGGNRATALSNSKLATNPHKLKAGLAKLAGVSERLLAERRVARIEEALSE